MIKKLILKYVTKAVEDAIDAYVKSTPDQIDDKIWEAIKVKINEYLEAHL